MRALDCFVVVGVVAAAALVPLHWVPACLHEFSALPPAAQPASRPPEEGAASHPPEGGAACAQQLQNATLSQLVAQMTKRQQEWGRTDDTAPPATASRLAALRDVHQGVLQALCLASPPGEAMPYCQSCLAGRAHREHAAGGDACAERLEGLFGGMAEQDLTAAHVRAMADVALEQANLTMLWIAVKGAFRTQESPSAWDLSERAMAATADSPPHRRVVVFERVYFLFRARRFREAAAQLEGAMDRRDAWVERAGGDAVLNYLPMCYLRIAHTRSGLERALAYVEAARGLHPAHYGLRHNTGLLLMSNGRWAQGSAEMAAALQAELVRWPARPYGEECTAWSVVDWNDLSHGWHPTTALLHPQSVVLKDQAALSPFGGQRLPLVLGPRTPEFACDGDTPCDLFTMLDYDTEAYFVNLSHAWVETPPGTSAVVLHSQCSFHLFSSQHVQPVAGTVPSEAALAAKPTKRLQCAFHLHWMHGYYQFVGEMLPKLLILQAAGRLRPDCPVLLTRTAYAGEFLRLLKLDEAAVLWYDPSVRYAVEHLHTLPFRPSPRLDIDVPDRLSVAPVFWLRRLRKVSQAGSGTRVGRGRRRCCFAPPDRRLLPSRDRPSSALLFSPASPLIQPWRRAGLPCLQLLAPAVPPSDRNLVVYVHRSDTAGQRSVQGDQLLRGAVRAAAHAAGYEFHVHADFRGRVPPTVVEQIQTFSRARAVVGAHGGGLTNAMFLAPGSAIVEFPLLPAQRTVFSVMAAALGLRYALAPCVNATQFGHFVVGERQAEDVRVALTAFFSESFPHSRDTFGCQTRRPPTRPAEAGRGCSALLGGLPVSRVFPLQAAAPDAPPCPPRFHAGQEAWPRTCRMCRPIRGRRVRKQS